MKLRGELFGRDALRHIAVGVGLLGAAIDAVGPLRGVFVEAAGRSLAFAAAALEVGGLYSQNSGHAASDCSERVRQFRVPSGR